MKSEILTSFFLRELDRLKEEISLFGSGDNLWKERKGISNSAGNLALHLIGNLNHFIGATLGNTGYIRERELEFTNKNVPEKQIISEIETTKKMIEDILSQLTPEDLDKDYPIEKSFGKVSTRFLLIHLITHLNYHLGQINYYRRIE